MVSGVISSELHAGAVSAHVVSSRTMARPLRIEYPGAVWHLTNRGVERRDIVADDFDLKGFIELMAAVVTRYRWRLHVWALMTNHFLCAAALVVETPETNVSREMKDLDGEYAPALNRRWSQREFLPNDGVVLESF